MTKIKLTKAFSTNSFAPLSSHKKVMNAVEKIMHPKAELKIIDLPELKSVKDGFDLSTEELGFYTYNGKVVNIIYPR